MRSREPLAETQVETSWLPVLNPSWETRLPYFLGQERTRIVSRFEMSLSVEPSLFPVSLSLCGHTPQECSCPGWVLNSGISGSKQRVVGSRLGVATGRPGTPAGCQGFATAQIQFWMGSGSQGFLWWLLLRPKTSEITRHKILWSLILCYFSESLENILVYIMPS